MFDLKSIQKLTWIVNTVLMVFVILLMGFFWYFGVIYMVYHSIPTLGMYVLFFYLIHKNKLHLYATLVYIVITIYMIAATICMGYNTGFHLYCMSLIPLAFYMQYLAHKLQIKCTDPLLSSLALIGAYLVSTIYVVLKGPVYTIDRSVAITCLIINALSVFFFLIGYASLMYRMVQDSETKLSDMAHTDRLTGLFNRHYMMTHLAERYPNTTPEQWIAMVDIDNFKKINDNYGHGGGDYILVELARIMQDVCRKCTISRWGGEEFLIIAEDASRESAILEQLRQTVEHTPFSYQGKDIAATITIGVSHYKEEQSLDNWIQSADKKLYEGKKSSKNCVIY